MAACEKCWAQASRIAAYSSRMTADVYRDLLLGKIERECENALCDDGDWRRERCGGRRWVGWAAGPNMPRRAQCVPCGHVQALPEPASEVQP